MSALSVINTFSNAWRSWWGGGAVSEFPGMQNAMPVASLVADTQSVSIDGALQIGTVWACCDRRASTLASLPFFAYDVMANGEKTLARTSRLYALLHDSPNNRHTPYEFWRAMMLNHDLRGNAYARIVRDDVGEAIALWPMPSDQVNVTILDNGTMLYTYRFGGNVAVFSEENVLHLKNLGNGSVGLEKLEFMRSTTDEATKAQGDASKVFGSAGKPTGVLMIDHVLSKDQREAVARNFTGMSEGNISRLFVLEASMKYQQLSLSPADQQLLESRKFSIEEICRWFDVPSILVNHSGDGTTWGTGIDSIIQGFFTVSLRPMLVNIEQAVRKRVMTSRQRALMTAEFNFDALMRGNPVQRAEMYAKHVQNGLMQRAEVRQLEGWPFMPGTQGLTVQSNLVPLELLGKLPPASGGNGTPILQ